MDHLLSRVGALPKLTSLFFTFLLLARRSRETPAVLIKKSRGAPRLVESSSLIVYQLGSSSSLNRAHTNARTSRASEHAGHRCLVIFFPAGPVPSGTLPAFYRPPGLSFGHPFGIRCCFCCLRCCCFGRTDNPCLPQQPRLEFIYCISRPSLTGLDWRHQSGSLLRRTETGPSMHARRAKPPRTTLIVAQTRCNYSDLWRDRAPTSTAWAAKNPGEDLITCGSIIIADAVGNFLFRFGTLLDLDGEFVNVGGFYFITKAIGGTFSQ